MKSFEQFLNICERYKSLPKGRMNFRAARTGIVGLGHLGIAGAAAGAEGAIGDLGDLPDNIASDSVERSVRPLTRSGRILRTTLTHSPTDAQEKERQNRKRGQSR